METKVNVEVQLKRQKEKKETKMRKGQGGRINILYLQL